MSGKRLVAVPVDFDEACLFVERLHRHHKPPPGHKFSIGAAYQGEIIGVAIVGRPVSRALDDGLTLEVTRLCTDGIRRTVVDRRGRNHSLGVCSFLYGAARRATFALGYRRLGTYILTSEPGTSLRAAGWRLIGEVKGRSWGCPSRPRVDKHPLQDKLRFGAPA